MANAFPPPPGPSIWPKLRPVVAAALAAAILGSGCRDENAAPLNRAVPIDRGLAEKALLEIEKDGGVDLAPPGATLEHSRNVVSCGTAFDPSAPRVQREYSVRETTRTAIEQFFDAELAARGWARRANSGNLDGYWSYERTLPSGPAILSVYVYENGTSLNVAGETRAGCA